MLQREESDCGTHWLRNLPRPLQAGTERRHGTTEDYGVLNPKWDSTCPTVDQNIQGKGSRKKGKDRGTHSSCGHLYKIKPNMWEGGTHEPSALADALFYLRHYWWLMAAGVGVTFLWEFVTEYRVSMLS